MVVLFLPGEGHDYSQSTVTNTDIRFTSSSSLVEEEHHPTPCLLCADYVEASVRTLLRAAFNHQLSHALVKGLVRSTQL
jgi:hypothetical protein